MIDLRCHYFVLPYSRACISLENLMTSQIAVRMGKNNFYQRNCMYGCHTHEMCTSVIMIKLPTFLRHILPLIEGVNDLRRINAGSSAECNIALVAVESERSTLCTHDLILCKD